MVEYIVAIDVTRARFPADAFSLLETPPGLIKQIANLPSTSRRQHAQTMCYNKQLPRFRHGGDQTTATTHREVDRPFHAPACTKPLPNALASTGLPQCQTIAWHPQHKILKPTSGKTNSMRNQIPRPGDTECFGRPAVSKYHAVSPRSSRCIVMYHIGRKYEIQAFEKL